MVGDGRRHQKQRPKDAPEMTDFDCSNPPSPTLELHFVSEMCLLIHLSSIACTHLHFEARFKKKKEKKKAKSEIMLAGVKVQKSSKV